MCWRRPDRRIAVSLANQMLAEFGMSNGEALDIVLMLARLIEDIGCARRHHLTEKSWLLAVAEAMRAHL